MRCLLLPARRWRAGRMWRRAVGRRGRGGGRRREGVGLAHAVERTAGGLGMEAPFIHGFLGVGLSKSVSSVKGSSVRLYEPDSLRKLVQSSAMRRAENSTEYTQSSSMTLGLMVRTVASLHERTRARSRRTILQGAQAVQWFHDTSSLLRSRVSCNSRR